MASRPRKGRREGPGSVGDSISEKPGQIPVPESHLILAEDRLAEYRRDPSRARPARDVLDRLTNPHR